VHPFLPSDPLTVNGSDLSFRCASEKILRPFRNFRQNRSFSSEIPRVMIPAIATLARDLFRCHLHVIARSSHFFHVGNAPHVRPSATRDLYRDHSHVVMAVNPHRGLPSCAGDNGKGGCFSRVSAAVPSCPPRGLVCVCPPPSHPPSLPPSFPPFASDA